jgi:precorrin-8X/cobalt-precorrin-8 methylmutase
VTSPFHRVVIVDWSASSTPVQGADSIWICTLDVATGRFDLANPPTRAAAFEAMATAVDAPGPVLLGVDAALGYPIGFARRLGLPGTPWEAVWEHLANRLHDDHRNRNDRWAVAADLNRRLGANHFWGVPPAAAGEHLTARRPKWTEHHLPTHRVTEQRLRERGRRPFSVWQLLGAGSVGSQAITCIAALQRLRMLPQLRERIRVWPFETGLELPTDDSIVVAEVWPSAIDVDHVDHPVKDARQVIALAQWFASHASYEMFPFDADDATRSAALEEGWVLGPT